MEREKLTKIILACRESSDGMSCYLPQELPEKMCLEILEKNAPGVSCNDVVGIFTTFVLTETALYGKTLDSPIPVDSPWKVVPIYKEDVLTRALIIFQDGTFCEDSSLKHILPLLKRLSAASGQETASLEPKVDYDRFHRLYGRQIRRELETAVNDSCGEWDRLYLRGSFPEEKIQKAIQVCRADIQPADVIAMEDVDLVAVKMVYLLTEYGLYAAYNKKPQPVILFDGLYEIICGKGHVLYFLYEDGHGTEALPREAPVEKFLRRVVMIYRRLRKAMAETDNRFILDIAKGWKKFLTMQKNQSLESRKNSVFVSSTFKDMHYERDAIHELVLPALNEVGNQYGQSMSFCDLRWGVNTEDLDSEAGSRKVLTVCLDEIERCRPYMLVILGERYGWVPEPGLIQSAITGRMDSLENLEKSVTALEIEFGTLSRTDQLERTRFYFRRIEGTPPDIYQSEDDWHARKLEQLKQRIQKLAGSYVKTYTLRWDAEEGCLRGLEEFSRMVTGDVLHMMEKEWAEASRMSPLEKELSAHWALAKQKAIQCSARDKQVQEILDMLMNGEGLMAVQGVSGSGKTTLMACLAMILSQSGAEVLPLFCGHTVRSNTALELMETVTDFLRQQVRKIPEYSEEAFTPESVRSYEPDRLRMEMNRLAAVYMRSGGKHIVILIDAVDQLPPDALRNSLKFLPAALNGRIRGVVSCTEDFPTAPARHVFSLPLLEETQRPVVIHGILNSMHRELADSAVKAIARKVPSASPLYISFLLQRLLMMNKADFDDIARKGDGIEAITARQLALIQEAPDTLPGICAWLLHSAAERVGRSLAEEILQYLAASRYGLRETDLEGLLQAKGISWNNLDFSLFINYINGMFLQREDGRYDFIHKSIRVGLLEYSTEKKELHRQICCHLETLPEWDKIRLQEWCYHCCQAEDGKRFTDYLTANRQDEKALGSMAEEAARYMDIDGGVFLQSLFLEPMDEVCLTSLIYFLVKPLSSSRELSRENLILLGDKVFPAGCPLAEELVKKAPSSENLNLLSRLYFQMGEAERKSGKSEGQITDWYECSLTLARRRHELSDSYESGTDLAEVLTSLGQVHVRLKNFEKARECYKESFEIHEKWAAVGGRKSQAQIADLYLCLGDLCCKESGKEQLGAAENYYLKAVSLREVLAEGSPDGIDRNALACCCQKLGNLYLKWQCSEYGEKALKYYGKELTLRNQNLQEDPGTANQQGVALVSQKIGACYEIIQGAGYQDQALTYYDQSIAYWEVVIREEGVDSLAEAYISARNTFISDHISACLSAAGILNKMEGALCNVRAARLYERAIDLSELIVKKKGSEGAYLRLMVSLQKAMEASPRVNKAFRIDVSSRITETARTLYKITGDSDYKDYIKTLKKWNVVKKVGKKFMNLTGM